MRLARAHRSPCEKGFGNVLRFPAVYQERSGVSPAPLCAADPKDRSHEPDGSFTLRIARQAASFYILGIANSAAHPARQLGGTDLAAAQLVSSFGVVGPGKEA